MSKEIENYFFDMHQFFYKNPKINVMFIKSREELRNKRCH